MEEYGDNAWKLRSSSIAILVGFRSGSCPGSCPVRVRFASVFAGRVRYVFGLVSGFASGSRSGSCLGSCLARVRFVSGFVSRSCLVSVRFVFGSCLCARAWFGFNSDLGSCLLF